MIEYKEVKLPCRDSMGSEGICKELNKLGRDDWLLVSPLHRIDGNSLVCIMAKECPQASKENNTQAPSVDVSALNTPTAVGGDTMTKVIDGKELTAFEIYEKTGDWRGQAKLLGIPTGRRKKVDVLAEIEKAKYHFVNLRTWNET